MPLSFVLRSGRDPTKYIAWPEEAETKTKDGGTTAAAAAAAVALKLGSRARAATFHAVTVHGKEWSGISTAGTDSAFFQASVSDNAPIGKLFAGPDDTETKGPEKVWLMGHTAPSVTSTYDMATLYKLPHSGANGRIQMVAMGTVADIKRRSLSRTNARAVTVDGENEWDVVYVDDEVPPVTAAAADVASESGPPSFFQAATLFAKPANGGCLGSPAAALALVMLLVVATGFFAWYFWKPDAAEWDSGKWGRRGGGTGASSSDSMTNSSASSSSYNQRHVADFHAGSVALDAAMGEFFA